MKMLKVLLTTGLAVATSYSAVAQFSQTLDTSPNGIGALATFNQNQQPGQPKPSNPILGDDWQVNFNGPVSEIAIWGSWLNNVVDPTVTFKLSIHRDNPPGSAGVPWSRPGQEIWSYVGQASDATLKASGISGNFYDFIGGQTVAGTATEATRFLFNFGANAFTAQAGSIYWLVVQAQTSNGATFAWNTSSQHNNDASVFGNSATFGNTRVVFNPMQQPGVDPIQNVDLAFTIAPEPSSFAIVGLGLAALMLRRKQA